MIKKFPIIEVPPDAPESFEEMGTKEKFWFRHQDLGRCLYKKARHHTGEDWAPENCCRVVPVAWFAPC